MASRTKPPDSEPIHKIWSFLPEDGGDPLTPKEVYLKGLTVQIPRWQGWARKAKEQLDQMITKDAA
jgi:hypothetical protein